MQVLTEPLSAEAFAPFGEVIEVIGEGQRSLRVEFQVVHNQASAKLHRQRFGMAVHLVVPLLDVRDVSMIIEDSNQRRPLEIAGLLGVLMSVVFNYSVTRVFTWR